MKVAIAGSSGYIGSALAERLERAGHEVVRLRRGAQGAPKVDWAPQDGWVRPGALDGVDALVNLAGVSIGAKRWTAGRREALISSRIDSTRTLVRHMASMSERPRVLINASAVGYYGYARGAEDLTEDGSKGEGFLADLVADWEAEARAAEAHGVRTVLLRTAPIIGPGSELIDRLAMPFKMGVGGTIGDGKQWFSWVSLEDELGVIEHALNDESVSGPINATSPNPVTNKEFTKALGSVLHRPTLLPLPAFMLRLVFGRGRAEETLLASQRVHPARAQSSGYRFAEPTIEGALRTAFGRGAGAGERRAEVAS
ncbi:MAG: TIGR01777 family oxidoreductase [Dehalococcoidia bacterium]